MELIRWYSDLLKQVNLIKNMAKKKRYRPDGDNDPELDISSLVDVAFLLLIYFLVTSTLRPDETDLSIV